MDALVTSAEQRSGLAAIRALGSRGLSVLAAGARSNSLGFRSRYAKECCVYPDYPAWKYDEIHQRSFVATIRRVVSDHRIPFVLPVSELETIALDASREAFEGLTRLALAPRKSLRLALDKRATLSLASELGIPIPESCLPSSVDEALSFARAVGYPIVMKPPAARGSNLVAADFPFKVRYARNPAELETALQPFEAGGAFPVLQEYCSGVCVAQSGLFVDGGFLGVYQHHRAREYPLTGGVASVVVSEHIEPELLSWSRKLLGAMEWEGVVQVEYRVDRNTDRAVLLEVNGRCWAPLSAANKLGLNFPYALYRYVMDGVKEKLPERYPEGKRFRFLRGDLIALEKYLRGDTVEVLDPLPSKGRVIWEMVKDFSPRVRTDVGDWSDPAPAARELLLLCRHYGAVVLRSARGFLRRNPLRGIPFRAAGLRSLLGSRSGNRAARSSRHGPARESEPKTVPQAIVEALEAEDVPVVFGLMGVHVLPVFVELAKSKRIRLLVSKHENNASFMADMVGRLTGKPGVVLVTAGPGATNSISGVAQAYLAGSPMVHLSATVNQKSPPFMFHGARTPDFLRRMFNEVTKWSVCARRVEETPRLMEEGFRSAVHGRPGPVHIEFPQNLLLAKPRPIPRYRSPGRNPYTAPPALARKAEAFLLGARAPVVLAGDGVLAERCSTELIQLAERFAMPIVCTHDSWGAVPDQHPLEGGTANGLIADSYARRILQVADAILGVGLISKSHTQAFLWNRGATAKMFLCSYEGTRGAEAPTRNTLVELLERIESGRRDQNPELAELLQQRKQAVSQWRAALIEEHAQSRPIHFGVAMARLANHLNEDALVIGGTGNHSHWNRAMLPIRTAGSRLQAGGWGTMGWELPGAIAAKLACPERQVVGITGDGSLLMAASDLGTAVEEGSNILLIVMNDSRYGMMDTSWPSQSGEPRGTGIRSPDFAALAKSFGATGVRVDDPRELDAAFAEAVAEVAKGPVVVDVVCGSEYPVPDFAALGGDLLLGRGRASLGFRASARRLSRRVARRLLPR
jgi:acetolactate synthase-1/2/3 large subunit